MDKGQVASTVVSSLTSVAGDITSTITQIAPIACGIVGVFLVWKFGIRFFKSVAK
ncbi:MAG: hypothetical protein H9W81_14915 [Enterococcus sp.]|mgnify:CR=1 FL=1|nr:hypothetical protein [Enterococcus sp.]